MDEESEIQISKYSVLTAHGAHELTHERTLEESTTHEDVDPARLRQLRVPKTTCSDIKQQTVVLCVLWFATSTFSQ